MTVHRIDPQATVRNIIENTLQALVAIGMTYENAASLLCIQGFIRVESEQQIEQLRDSINGLQGDEPTD